MIRTRRVKLCYATDSVRGAVAAMASASAAATSPTCSRVISGNIGSDSSRPAAVDASGRSAASRPSELYAGYTLVGLGAAAAVADAVLWYLWARHRPSQPLSLRPLLAPSTMGMAVVGAF